MHTFFGFFMTLLVFCIQFLTEDKWTRGWCSGLAASMLIDIIAGMFKHV